MENRAQYPEPPWRAAGTSIITIVLSLFLAACSEAKGINTNLPGASDAPAGTAVAIPTTSATSQAATERLVRQRYLDFQRIVAEVGATSNADDPRLAEYATGAVLENLRGKLAVRRQEGVRLYGAPVSRIQSVSVSANQATVRDCLDNSATGLVDKAGKKLSVGRARQETTATLVHEDGTWKVSEITTVAGGGSC
jgi:hypothetical protein